MLIPISWLKDYVDITLPIEELAEKLATVEYGGDEPEVTVTGTPNLFQYLNQGDISPLKPCLPFSIWKAANYYMMVTKKSK